MPESSRFWRALEAIPGWTAVQAIWKGELGPEFADASRFLRPTLHEALAFPCPSPGGSGCPRRVVRHPQGDIVAVCGDDPRRCESIRLSSQDAVLYEIDVSGLAKEMISGLGFSSQHLGMTTVPGLWRVGSYTASFDKYLPVYFLARQSSHDVRQSAQEFAVSADAPAIVLIPTATWADEARPALAKSGSILIALDRVLTLVGGGQLERSDALGRILAEFGQQEAPSVSARYLLRKNGAKWTASFGGEPFYLDDAVGLRYLACLLASPGKEFGVVELAEACGLSGARLRAGSAGESLDPQALREYRERKEELQEQLGKAQKNSDLSSENAIKDQIDAIDQELSRAVGRGGRRRHLLDQADRDRKRVSMAIERALNGIKKHCPEMWRHLDNHLRRGRTVVYRPDSTLHWET